MPLSVNNPRDLFLTMLSDVLYVERQLAFEVVPELLKSAQSPSLTSALGNHLEQTKRHAETVEQAFRAVQAEPSSNQSDAFDGLTNQHSQLAGSILDDTLADVFHASSSAHVERYEIGAYKTLIALAQAMGRDDVVELLEPNLADEKQALEQLQQVIGELTRAAVQA